MWFYDEAIASMLEEAEKREEKVAASLALTLPVVFFCLPADQQCHSMAFVMREVKVKM